MRVVQYERKKADLTYAPATARTAVRVARANSEQRINADIDKARVSHVYLVGRSSRLAAEVKVGDLLDCHEVKRVVENSDGLLEVTTQEVITRGAD